ncbi:hypothetical protein BY458DRAFT_433446, partial [Sporodiniella umbellata]
SFWTHLLTHPLCNLWYRMFHKKTPCKTLLYSFNLSALFDGSCTLSRNPETIFCLLFTCPAKQRVWVQTWSH